MNGLQILDLKRANFIERVLNKKVEENAYLEIQNRLASVPILALPPDAIAEILNDYEVSFERAKPRLRNYYRKVLRHFVQGGDLSEEKLEQLRHLQTLFFFSDIEAEQMMSVVLHPIYEAEVKAALSYRFMTQEKRDHLNTLMLRLRIPESSATSIYKKHAETVMQQAVEEALAIHRLSPEEDSRLSEIAENLGVQVCYDRSTQVALERCRMLWRIEKGELPKVRVPLNLQPDEACSAYVKASYFESRRSSRPIQIDGARMKISLHVMKNLCGGTLYITNKRLLFNGTDRATSIGLHRILYYSLKGGDLEIKKDYGRDQMFRLESDSDLVEAIMKAQMAAARS
jgi:hypothetical protein